MPERDADEKIKNFIAENPALHIATKSYWFNLFAKGNWTVTLWRAKKNECMNFKGGPGIHHLIYYPNFIWANAVPK